MDDVINRDKAGEFPRNLVNPVYKDTVTVGSKGGYAIIRFKADNPGIWLFHCHNEGHMMQGMALVFKVGNTNQFPVPPAYFPVCGKTITDMQTKNLHPTSASDGLNTCAFIFGFALLYKYVCFDLI
ncbi:hypothetical protein DPMN_174335 [Dreissena polymorpha]|uniref:Plastocyanin-like domain-containing protein n=2 Tax=Dreissena polymorpha TaxID=45954 RepID=A0A9D4IHS3_DREPO|nr:hypothetical protein DPMN_174335 [Dreissena polymorpha]